ncbi:hypothetical protein G6L26_008645 [Agrobacterium radiobacter]|uniref:Uncharacterized protein n=1 Tax=Agrobacterium tumefaciens str. B6 TaxID=1183423 RepID=A0A822UXN5_AGRTU|nr:hypothetical protein [Agrobacterium tumefaciens]NTA05253.1 hypothetical protein [Agrobacterium tumefaciens]NTB12998.1 hypothetical protein [Agrobacterium tumefaciens]CVI15750.1 exported hypothetical protein [Agrobacterium tumefaciens str. B6]SPZ36045.1 Uncharacterised protein [Agrobacterium tumefaciens]
MLVLRVLWLPIAMAAFAILHTAAIKAPEVMEAGSLAFWIVLPLLIVGKLIRRHV